MRAFQLQQIEEKRIIQANEKKSSTRSKEGAYSIAWIYNQDYNSNSFSCLTFPLINRWQSNWQMKTMYSKNLPQKKCSDSKMMERRLIY
jgi:hypothetical protein